MPPKICMLDTRSMMPGREAGGCLPGALSMSWMPDRAQPAAKSYPGMSLSGPTVP